MTKKHESRLTYDDLLRLRSEECARVAQELLSQEGDEVASRIGGDRICAAAIKILWKLNEHAKIVGKPVKHEIIVEFVDLIAQLIANDLVSADDILNKIDSQRNQDSSEMAKRMRSSPR